MQERFDTNGRRLVFSHGCWMTEKEDANTCDIVDSIMQGDYE